MTIDIPQFDEVPRDKRIGRINVGVKSAFWKNVEEMPVGVRKHIAGFADLEQKEAGKFSRIKPAVDCDIECWTNPDLPVISFELGHHLVTLQEIKQIIHEGLKSIDKSLAKTEILAIERSRKWEKKNTALIRIGETTLKRR